MNNNPSDDTLPVSPEDLNRPNLAAMLAAEKSQNEPTEPDPTFSDVNMSSMIGRQNIPHDKPAMKKPNMLMSNTQVEGLTIDPKPVEVQEMPMEEISGKNGDSAAKADTNKLSLQSLEKPDQLGFHPHQVDETEFRQTISSKGIAMQASIEKPGKAAHRESEARNGAQPGRARKDTVQAQGPPQNTSPNANQPQPIITKSHQQAEKRKESNAINQSFAESEGNFNIEESEVSMNQRVVGITNPKPGLNKEHDSIQAYPEPIDSSHRQPPSSHKSRNADIQKISHDEPPSARVEDEQQAYPSPRVVKKISYSGSDEARNVDEDSTLLNEDIKKRQVDYKDFEQSFFSIMKTVLRYVVADIQKKARSFKIGVFTVFLVVCFITMLKSIIDVAPIAFLKVGQDQAGAFDFSITSDYSDPIFDGDVNIYDADPFKYEEVQKEPNLFASLLQDQGDLGDHISIFGFNLIKFSAYKDQLDELAKGDTFQGFSPRWLLPTKIRNVTNPARNTSAILIVVDSAREHDFQMTPYFTDEIIGDSEMIVSSNALKFLNVTENRKEKVEIFFDFAAIFDTFAGMSNLDVPDTKEVDKAVNEAVTDQVDSLIEDLLGQSNQLAQLLRQAGLKVNDQNQIEFDLAGTIRQAAAESNINLSNFTLPQLDLQSLLPDTNINFAFLEDLNLTLPDGSTFNTTNLREVLEGQDRITLNLQNVLTTLDNNNQTTINIPVEQILSAVSTIDYFPTYLAHNFTVADAFKKPNGKFSENLGNVVLVDCHYINNMFGSTYQTFYDRLIEDNPAYFFFVRGADTVIQETIKGIDFCNYALSIEGVIKDQIGSYTNSRAIMNDRIGEAGNELISALTLQSNITVSTPLKTSLKSVELITVFMNTMMATIIIFLGILCVQLIYSLMLSDVEEKTYEFGMLRALGFNKNNIMITIIIQAMTFALPGLFTGLFLSALANFGLRHVLFSLTNNYSSYHLSLASIWIGVFIGTVLPLVSNVIPIQNALGKNLRASLDMYHRSNNELSISLKTAMDLGLSPSQFMFAIMLIVAGIATYYVAPVAFLFGNFELFFMILNGILLMMILGLTYVSILLFPILQKFLLYTFLAFYPPDWKLRSMVQKNIDSHRRRNQKTAIMFSICLSFLFFAGNTFQLIGNLIKGQLEQVVGADFHAFSIDTRSMTSFIAEVEMSQFLKEQQEFDGAVLGWTFSSVRLSNILKHINPQEGDGTFFSDLAGYKPCRNEIYAVQRNYLDVMDLKYYYPNEFEQELLDQSDLTDDPEQKISKIGGKYNVMDMVYSNLTVIQSQEKPDSFDVAIVNNPEENDVTQNLDEIKVIIPEGFRDVLSMTTERGGRMCVGQKNNCKFAYRAKVRAMLTKVPSWFFTAYQNVQFFSQSLVSTDQYKSILEDYFKFFPDSKKKYDKMIETYNFDNDVPKLKVYIKLKEDISDSRREFLANGIRSFFRDDRTVLLDLKDTMKQIQASLTLFQIFVAVIGFIALTLAFFLLLISTTQNIRENIWEYGCLRAMGFTKNQGLRCFLYEQYSVIIASLILGTIVGVILSSVVTAQFFLFLEQPFSLDLPMELMYIMYTMALVTTFFAVYIPVKKVNEKKIAYVLKGLD